MMISMQTQTDINFELMLNFMERDLPRLISYEATPLMFDILKEMTEDTASMNKKLRSELEVLVRGILEKHLPKVRLSPSVSNAEVKKGCCNDQDDYRWKNGNYKIMPIPDGEDHDAKFSNIICRVCDEKFEDYFKLVNHLPSHQGHSKKKLKCPECAKTTTSPSLLGSHIQMMHLTTKQKLGNYKCKTCQLEFCSFASLSEHERIHKKGIPQCTKCGVVFEYPSQLKSHCQFSTSCGNGVVNPNKPTSQLDAAKIGDALLLALGPATDTAAQATTPLVASPKLAQPSSLAPDPMVMNSEGVPVPFSEFLKDREAQQAALAIQPNPVVVGKKFKCSLCARAFTSLSMLNHHTNKAHVETKSLSCTKCTKLFATYPELDSHYHRIHTTAQRRGIVENKVLPTVPQTKQGVLTPVMKEVTQDKQNSVKKGRPAAQISSVSAKKHVLPVEQPSEKEPSAVKREAAVPTKVNPKRQARRKARYTEETEG